MAPFHPTGQNPTLALERDLDLIEHLDRLGFDEVWIGEHHSGGYEIISSPEVFIAAAAERTKYIRLGSGVNSLPYHHPLLLADRFVLLDHLTRGRAMLGCGPGPADVRRAHARHPGRPAAAAHGRSARRDHGAAPRRDRDDGDRLVHAAGRAPAAEAVQRTEPRGRGRGIDLADRRDRGRHVRHRAAVDRGDHAAGLRRARHALADVERGRRPARPHGRPREVAARRADAPRGDEGAGAQGRGVRHRAVLPLLHARAAGRARCAATPRRRSSTTSTRTASRSSARPTTRSARSRSSSTSPAASARSCCSGTTGPTPPRRSAASSCSRSTSCRTSATSSRGRRRSCDWVTGSGGEFVNRAANAIMQAIADHAADKQDTPAP